MRKSGIFTALAAALLLAACGGNDNGSSVAATAAGGGGAGGGTTATPAFLTVTSSAITMPSDGSATVDVTAFVRDATNNLIAGVPVTFTASTGGIAGSPATSDASGVAKATLSTAGVTTLRVITVTATVGALVATVPVQVVLPGNTGGGGGGATAASLTVVSSSSSIPSDGSSPAVITAFVRDANNALISGVPVTFSATSGGVGPATATSDAAGKAVTNLSTAGDTALRTITVTATAGGRTATVNVQVVASSGTNSVQMGSGTGAGFQAGIIGVSNPNLAAGGSTSLTVSLVQSDGTLFTQSAAITFNSQCVANNSAQIQPAAVATTTTGIATVTYVSKGCSGADAITATATVGTQQLSASGTVTIAAAAIGSIQFVSATPTSISLKGTGASGRSETSTVVFKVLDSANGPRPGATVTFQLASQQSPTVTGVTLTPLSAPTGLDGTVQTVVSAGTVATTVSVIATVQTQGGASISTQSNELSISTGIPTTNNISLSVLCPNVEGWDTDGDIVPVTVRMTDRFSNPVPNGTAANFRTEYGGILPQCQTASTATESGVCTVNWVSKAPRTNFLGVNNGRSSLLVTATGEESFVDVNANGVFDGTDTFTNSNEPFLDVNENATHEGGEDFIDFDSSNTYNDGSSNDGLLNSALCQGSQCSTQRSVAIGARNVIIMSGNHANFTVNPAEPLAGFTLPQTIDFTIVDDRGQQMPAGTTITGTVSSGAGSIVGSSTYTWPCSSSATPRSYSFILIPPTTGAIPGFLFISVKTPKGVETTTSVRLAN